MFKLEIFVIDFRIKVAVYLLFKLLQMENQYSKLQLFNMQTPILTTSNLGDIYPGVSEELCNKHAKQLSKLKTLFGDIYDQMQPQGFVVVNGVAKVVDLSDDLQLNFALENGITIVYSKTYENQGIFINGNHVEQELEFNSKGRHEDGIHEKIDEIKDLIKGIRRNGPAEKEYYGGIIYIHSNIGEHLLGFNECFMIAVAVALLMIHEEAKNYNKKKLGELILQADEKVQKKLLCSILEKFEMNKVLAELYLQGTKYQSQCEFDINICHPKSDKSIGTNESNEAIRMNDRLGQKKVKTPKKNKNNHQSIESLESPGKIYKEELRHLNIRLKENHKLIFCKMDLSKSQERYYEDKMSTIKATADLLEKKKIHRSELVDERGEIVLPGNLKEEIKEEQLHLLEYCEEVRCLMASLVTNHIEFDEFISQKHKLDLQYQIHDDAVFDLIAEVHRQIKYIEHFCVLQGHILLISMDRQYYTQIMVYLRKMLNEYKFSTYKYLETMKKTHAEEEHCEIGEVMFTSMPSLGCAIYTPKEDQLWL